MSETQIVSLKCPNCGGALSVGASMQTFACGYCGASVMVERGGGTVSLSLLGEGIARVQRGTDKTAAELAIRRLTEEVAEARRELSSFYSRSGGTVRECDARIEAESVGTRKVAGAVLLAAGLAWLAVLFGQAGIYMAVVPGTNPFPLAARIVMHAIAIGAGLVAGAALWGLRERRRRGRIAAAIAAKAVASEVLEQAALPYRTRLNTLERKLAENRAIAEA